MGVIFFLVCRIHTSVYIVFCPIHFSHSCIQPVICAYREIRVYVIYRTVDTFNAGIQGELHCWETRLTNLRQLRDDGVISLHWIIILVTEHVACNITSVTISTTLTTGYDHGNIFIICFYFARHGKDPSGPAVYSFLILPLSFCKPLTHILYTNISCKHKCSLLLCIGIW